MDCIITIDFQRSLHPEKLFPVPVVHILILLLWQILRVTSFFCASRDFCGSYLGVRGVQRECYTLSTISILYVLLVNFKKSKIKHPSKQKNFCTIVTPKKKSNFLLSPRYLFDIKLFYIFFSFPRYTRIRS